MSDTVTLCSDCGQPIGAPHVLLPTDCVLTHDKHAERFQGLLCARHFHWLTDTLHQIEELFVLRGLVLLPGPASGGEIHGTRDGSPAPGRVEVMAITDRRSHSFDIDEGDIPDVPGTLAEWARMVGQERAPGYAGSSVTLLLKERRWIAQQDWVNDFTTEITVLHRALARAVGESMWPKSIGKCPNCTVKLFNTIGVDQVTCTRCKTVWTGAALVRLRLIHEQEGQTA